jgi:hypothetical protein
LEPGNGAMAAILAANPHRVFISRIGRVEVYQPIPPPDGKSPQGPHTHLLPRLLRHECTHSATEFIPTGWVPCAHLYPPHPVRDAVGQSRSFRQDRHASFQDLLARFGEQNLFEVKRRVVNAIRATHEPSAFPLPDNRYGRAALRIALRQIKVSGELAPAIDAWLSAYDHVDPAEPTEEHPCS